jgi:trigger factor
MSEDKPYTTQIKELENSEIEIEGEIKADLLEKHRAKVIKEMKSGLEIPGFRKGKAPDKVIIERVGEMNLLHEMAEEAIKEVYPEIILENKIDAVGRPNVTITKITPGQPLAFKIRTAVMPEVVMPDYKSIAKEQNQKKTKVEVTPEEVDVLIEQVRKQWFDITKKKNGGESKKSKDEGSQESELPAFDDEFVKKIGDFKNVQDFKDKMKENLLREKEYKESERIRLATADSIINGSKINLPNIFIEWELDRMGAQFSADIEKMGMKPEQYLKNIGKTEEELREAWREDAKKRAKLQLILNKIASDEKLTLPKDELEKESLKLLEIHKDADEIAVRAYVENVMLNQKVFEFLESQK